MAAATTGTAPLHDLAAALLERQPEPLAGYLATVGQIGTVGPSRSRRAAWPRELRRAAPPGLAP